MLLLLEHSELPTCSDCRKWLHDPDNGWKRSSRGDKDNERRSDNPPPCFRCPKVPLQRRKQPINKVPLPTWRDAHELSAMNQIAYHHYLECKAVGQFPDDAIVRRNAGLIRQAEEIAERSRQRRMSNSLEQLGAVMQLVGLKG